MTKPDTAKALQDLAAALIEAERPGLPPLLSQKLVERAAADSPLGVLRDELERLRALVADAEGAGLSIPVSAVPWDLDRTPEQTSGSSAAAPVAGQSLTVEPVKLEDIEQYRLQMAGISTAALGYWKEGDGILPDYDTPALRDVAKLYAKYDALYKMRVEAQANPPNPPAQAEPVAPLREALKHAVGMLERVQMELLLDDRSPSLQLVSIIRDGRTALSQPAAQGAELTDDLCNVARHLGGLPPFIVQMDGSRYNLDPGVARAIRHAFILATSRAQAPAAAPLTDEARDAARWRHAREMARCNSIDGAAWVDFGQLPWPIKTLPDTADYADAAIDAAMAAAKEQP